MSGKEYVTRAARIAEAVAIYPPAPWPLRLPIIRHVRGVTMYLAINRKYASYPRLGYLPLNADFDYAIANAVLRGEK